MPEGPEVVITIQYLINNIKNSIITNLNVISGRYTHQDLKGKKLLQNNNYKIINIHSKGKFIWFELQKNNKKLYILNTLGMSGHWGFDKHNSNRVVFTFKKNNNDNAKKYSLYFTDQRNFGTLEITDDYTIVSKKLDKLGIDLLKTKLKTNELSEHIQEFIDKNKTRKFNTNIVKILMSQEKNKGIGSGIGNYLCSEILYDAKISPHRTLISLNIKEVDKLSFSIKKVMKNAYVYNVIGYMKAFDNFMKNHKSDIKKKVYEDYHNDIKINDKEFIFKVYQQDKDLKGNNVKSEIIFNKRTTWWVPKLQK